jgi:hypothetical protein
MPRVYQQVNATRRGQELWWAFAAVLVITLVYLGVLVWSDTIPPASDLFGHGLGILGFLLMLATETLYSIRKRSRYARWGRMSTWLSAHIFTGIVGPYMVLLHTSWKFQGLAGLTLLLTALVVISGFIGRYIYTAVPRSIEGLELENEWLQGEISKSREELNLWCNTHPKTAREMALRLGVAKEVEAINIDMLIDRYQSGWIQRVRWRHALSRLDPVDRRLLLQLEELLSSQDRLSRQARSLAATRRMFSLWHMIHIPLGLVLFTAALIHIVATIYYATLLR